MTIDEAFNLAVEHQSAGRLGEAESVCRQILQIDPQYAQAIHLLGVLAHLSGRNDLALDLINRSIAIQPHSAEFYVNQGVTLNALGRLGESIVAYRHAAALAPKLPEAQFSLGGVLVAASRPAEAEACFRRALLLRPQYPEAANNLGTLRYERRELNEAIELYKQAIAHRPIYHEAYNNLGNAYFDKGEFDKALDAFRRSARSKPDYSDAYNNIGRVQVQQNDLNEAVESFQRAIALQPDHAQAHANLVNALYRMCRMEEAIAQGRRAISVDPKFATPHWNLGLCLLCNGQFEEGWKEYVWRTEVPELHGLMREFAEPPWDGSDLAGKRILLHAEQGFGDTIQFIRYLPMVQARGGKVMFDCRRELMGLFNRCFKVEEPLMPDQPLPEFDVHCPLLSLPKFMNTNLGNIPADVPYLFADPRRGMQWRERLSEHGGLKVGLVWAGRPEHPLDRFRSLPLSALAPLAGVSDVVFFSLQNGKESAQTKNPPAGMKLIDFSDDLSDFEETVALISNLDLVIAVDTSVAHLAGAMAKPVWLLLPFSPDWRWVLHRTDSPWYPTMRLFRQSKFDDWASVFASVAEALRWEVARRR
jgi:tetratricopeptide (TPR) repeat protein